MVRADLETVLQKASAWVQSEMAYLEDLAQGLALSRAVESGPGVVYSAARSKVLRVHPKRRYIGIGLPDPMRSDVAELTNALRQQRGSAWFNYTPDTSDRDTIALLVQMAMARNEVKGGSAEARSRRAASPLGRDDEADLELVLTAIRAFKTHLTATGVATVLRPLREVVFFCWEGPRLPRGGTRARAIPHSPRAREQRILQGSVKGLVYEHVSPVSAVLRHLVAKPPANTTELRRVLERHSDRVLITRDEDQALTAAGFRDSAPDPADPWSRYTAIGLTRDSFEPIG